MTDRTPLSPRAWPGSGWNSSPRTSADAIEHLLAHTTPAAISHHKVGRRRRRNGSPREAGDDRSAPDRTGCVWIEVLVCLGNDVLLIQGSAKEPARQGGSSHQRPNPNLKGLRRLDHRLRTGWNNSSRRAYLERVREVRMMKVERPGLGLSRGNHRGKIRGA